MAFGDMILCALKCFGAVSGFFGCFKGFGVLPVLGFGALGDLGSFFSLIWGFVRASGFRFGGLGLYGVGLGL